MRNTHLTPTHLRAAVNKASLGALAAKTGSGTGSKTGSELINVAKAPEAKNSEALEPLVGIGGGAERGRTAASQFCRLLP
jgi:hypothetical protein